MVSYLDLLEYGAIAAILSLVVSLLTLVLVIIVLARQTRTAEPSWTPQQQYRP